MYMIFYVTFVDNYPKAQVLSEPLNLDIKVEKRQPLGLGEA